MVYKSSELFTNLRVFLRSVYLPTFYTRLLW